MASATVAPAVTDTVISACALGNANTTSSESFLAIAATVCAVNLRRSLGKSVDQRIAGSLKIRTNHQIERATFKFELELKRDLASIFAELAKIPTAGKMTKRPVNQLQRHGPTWIHRIACAKSLAQFAAMQFQRCLDDIAFAKMHIDVVAPGQK